MAKEIYCINTASKLIKDGHLVAFPTETVYGLGANINFIKSVERIFGVKGRPLTDPLIVHTYTQEKAFELFKLSDLEEKNIMKIFADNLWPGALTIISEASDKINDIITASTGFVGVRIPSSKITLDFLKESGVPIAAPSANKFGHVSPTTAKHVISDFIDDDIYVFNGGDVKNIDGGIGIESTIIKINTNDKVIEILRLGGIGIDIIKSLLLDYNLDYSVQIKSKTKSLKTPEIAPGQSIKHYSPNVNTILLSSKSSITLETITKLIDNRIINKDLINIGIIDFNNIGNELSEIVKVYLDLSSNGNIKEAKLNIYDYLRKMEHNNICQLLLLKDDNVNDTNYLSLIDRMFRASSGNHITI